RGEETTDGDDGGALSCFSAVLEEDNLNDFAFDVLEPFSETFRDDFGTRKDIEEECLDFEESFDFFADEDDFFADFFSFSDKILMLFGLCSDCDGSRDRDLDLDRTFCEVWRLRDDFLLGRTGDDSACLLLPPVFRPSAPVTSRILLGLLPGDFDRSFLDLEGSACFAPARSLEDVASLRVLLLETDEDLFRLFPSFSSRLVRCDLLDVDSFSLEDFFFLLEDFLSGFVSVLT
ncbi:MAG: hypothetical protein ACX936_21565, partial [Marinobacter sp.]